MDSMKIVSVLLALLTASGDAVKMPRLRSGGSARGTPPDQDTESDSPVVLGQPLEAPEAYAAVDAKEVDVHPQNASERVGSLKKAKALSPSALESVMVDMLSARRDIATPLQSFVDSMEPIIKQMQDAIGAGHNSSQVALNTFQSSFDACSNAKGDGESSAAGYKSSRDAHSSTHKTCRTGEDAARVKYGESEEKAEGLERVKDSKCGVYESAKKNPGCDNRVAPDSTETYEEWIEKAKQFFTMEVDEIARKKQECNNATSAYDIALAEAKGNDGNGGLKKVYVDKKAACDDEQTKLEATTCTWAEKLNSTCTAFAACAGAEGDAYRQSEADVKTHERGRWTEWKATKRLQCLIGVFGDNGGSDKLEACKNLVVDSSHLELVYPSPPTPPLPCPPMEPHPCGSAYVAEEYGALPPEAPAGECSSCAWVEVCSAYTCPDNFQKKPNIDNEVGADADTCCEQVGFDASGENLALSGVAITSKGYDFGDDVYADLASQFFQWGTGGFSVSATVTPKNDARIAADSNRRYGVLFIKSSQYGAPFTGPVAFLWDDGKVKFRLASTTKLGKSCQASVPGGWRKDVPVRLEFTREVASSGDTLRILVDSVELATCSTHPGRFDVNNAAPFRLGGNHKSPKWQSINAYLSNLKSEHI